jgi:hypothetical protein
LDVELYLRVIWRFRLLVGLGFVLAVVLAVLSFTRVSFAHGTPKLAYRQAQTFEADTILLVGQKRPSFAGTSAADLSTFSSLATFYAQFVSSDAVQSLIDRQLPASERRTVHVQAAASVPNPGVQGAVLPFIEIQGFAEQPGRAVDASLIGANVFMQYIAAQQERAGVRANDRVAVSLVKRPTLVRVVVPRKKTVPIAVFLAIMIATLGAAFVLENLRPQPKRLAGDESANEASAAARRVA